MPRILVYVSVVVLALALQVSSIPTAASSQSGSASGNPSRPDTSVIDAILHRLPPRSQVIHDPTGYYEYVYVSPRVFTINISGYMKVNVDPYSHLFGKASIEGAVVYVTVPDSNVSSAININTANWAGVGGGFCQSFSGTSSAMCNNPSDSINENVADSYDSVTWNQACVPSTATSCITAFWGGMSQTDTGSGYLVQNGYNSHWVSGGSLTLQGWYQIACSQGCGNQHLFAQQPTTGWQNQEYQAITKVLDANCPGPNCTHTAYFYDYIGVGGAVYSASTTLPSPAAQNTFVQGEGIMEAPTQLGIQLCQLVTWSPNPLRMRGYYIGSLGNIQYYGTGPSYWTANLNSNCNGNLLAYGTQTSGATTYSLTHK